MKIDKNLKACPKKGQKWDLNFTSGINEQWCIVFTLPEYIISFSFLRSHWNVLINIIQYNHPACCYFIWRQLLPTHKFQLCVAEWRHGNTTKEPLSLITRQTWCCANLLSRVAICPTTFFLGTAHKQMVNSSPFLSEVWGNSSEELCASHTAGRPSGQAKFQIVASVNAGKEAFRNNKKRWLLY